MIIDNLPCNHFGQIELLYQDTLVSHRRSTSRPSFCFCEGHRRLLKCNLYYSTGQFYKISLIFKISQLQPLTALSTCFTIFTKSNAYSWISKRHLSLNFFSEKHQKFISVKVRSASANIVLISWIKSYYFFTAFERAENKKSYYIW